MDSLIIARVIHVIMVILWIGGVAMVTLVLLPAVKAMAEPAERVALFEKIEHKFAWQSRITTVLTALSGAHLLMATGGWQRLSLPGQWWLHAMIALWLVFTLMLFVFEPLFLHRWFLRRATEAPEKVFRLIQRLHYVLLTLSLITVVGAVAGSHGYSWL